MIAHPPIITDFYELSRRYPGLYPGYFPFLADRQICVRQGFFYPPRGSGDFLEAKMISS